VEEWHLIQPTTRATPSTMSVTVKLMGRPMIGPPQVEPMSRRTSHEQGLRSPLPWARSRLPTAMPTCQSQSRCRTSSVGDVSTTAPSGDSSRQMCQPTSIKRPTVPILPAQDQLQMVDMSTLFVILSHTDPHHVPCRGMLGALPIGSSPAFGTQLTRG
jgi:hypothetical protein